MARARTLGAATDLMIFLIYVLRHFFFAAQFRQAGARNARRRLLFEGCSHNHATPPERGHANNAPSPECRTFSYVHLFFAAI